MPRGYSIVFAARVLGTVLLMSVAAPCLLGQLAASRVSVKRDSSSDLAAGEARTTYSLDDQDEHAELIADRMSDPRLKTELRFNVWRGGTRSHGDDAALPITRRISFFLPLMERLLAEMPEQSFGLLFYGYRELYDRLPSLAASDSGWDCRTGHAVDKAAGYKYLAALLDRGNAYKELTDAVASLHYRVHAAGGLEELRVLPAANLSESQRKGLPSSTKPSDLLPSHIAIDFTLTKEKNGA